MKSSQNPSILAFLADYRRRGYAVLRHQSLTDFVALSDRMGRDFWSWEPGRQQIVGGNSGRSFAAGLASVFIETGRDQLHEVPLHGELTFHHPRPPELLWAYCAQAGTGGELQICDGVELYAALRPEVREFLNQPVIYVRRHDRATWTRLYQTESRETLAHFLAGEGIELRDWGDDGVETRFVTSALSDWQGRKAFVNNLLPFGLRQLREPAATHARVCQADGSDFPAAILLEIWEQAQAMTHTWPWQSGDLILLDNRRLLHGRARREQPGCEILVRMSHRQDAGLQASSAIRAG